MVCGLESVSAIAALTAFRGYLAALPNDELRVFDIADPAQFAGIDEERPEFSFLALSNHCKHKLTVTLQKWLVANMKPPASIEGEERRVGNDTTGAWQCAGLNSRGMAYDPESSEQPKNTEVGPENPGDSDP